MVTYSCDPDTVMPNGPSPPEFRPVISDALIVAPEVVYSPTVPAKKLDTKTFDPEMAILE